jgi:hypothetical protein
MQADYQTLDYITPSTTTTLLATGRATNAYTAQHLKFDDRVSSNSSRDSRHLISKGAALTRRRHSLCRSLRRLPTSCTSNFTLNQQPTHLQCLQKVLFFDLQDTARMQASQCGHGLSGRSSAPTTSSRQKGTYDR